MVRKTKPAAGNAKRAPVSGKQSKSRRGARKITKAEQISALLRKQKGASLGELMKATGWQQHSLRGYMSGTLVKRQGLTVTSTKIDGERRYRIVSSGGAP
jgi:hypothetical protein